ncbi:DUF7261 family protein [Halorussus amylolyticus]|uniref:DUF7261 family protein n=1 Tax=Halorussus amylolyticus TaxID=1126242 RepID=UPI0010484F8B|nr:hypothetical protein [Halorussus amylolyticus]
MADVDDRGQIILITGLAIAVTMVALVLVLNTVIYTENLATRNTGVGERDAIEYRNAAIEGVGGLVDRENAAEYASDAEVEAAVESGVRRLADLLARDRVASGAIAELRVETTWEGDLVRQTDTDREMTAADGSESWALAGNVEEVRGFALTVEDDDLSGSSPADAFTVVADDGDDRWRAAVYDDGGVTVAVRNASQGDWTEGVCSDATGETTTIDLTAGAVNGESCSALAFGEGVGESYDLRYENGGAAVGTYDLTVNTSGDAEIDGSNFDAPGSSPYVVDAVYGLELSVRYERARLAFADRLRVAPGESR